MSEFKDDDLNLDEIKNLREEIEEESNIPSGYIPIELSTKGNLGAPALFHIKNFSVEQISSLSFIEQDQIPIKILKMLPEIVWEKDVDFRKFHEGEVIETLIILYKTFYQSVLAEQTWPLTDEDKKYILEKECNNNKAEYNARIAAYNNGDWKPVFDINLDSIQFYDNSSSAKHTVKVTKKNGFECEFTYPKYGDTLVIHEIITRKFQEKENYFAPIKEKLKFRQKMEESWKNGEPVDIGRCPVVGETDKRKYEEFQIEKGKYLTRLTRAILLKSINGTDVSGLPIEERIKYADDPNLDFSTMNKVTALFKELKVGPIEKLTVIDPIVKEVREIPYTFRVFDFILALRSNGHNDDDIVLM